MNEEESTNEPLIDSTATPTTDLNDISINAPLHETLHNDTFTNSSLPDDLIPTPAPNSTLIEISIEPSALPSFYPTLAPSLKPTWPPPPPPSNQDVGHIESTDTTVLRSTIQIYGTLYLIFLALFCVARRRYNKYFNIRSWVKELECDIAKNSDYGLISWMWKVFQVDENDILEQCGMDALCFIRVLRLGRKLALVGCIQACWLIPVYATAEDGEETYYLEDRLVVISTAHIPSGSPRFLATVICAYIVFGYAMWLIQWELHWYTLMRHKFLVQRRPRNYAVYVSGIPEELRSGSQLAEFFRQSGATSSVLEAHVVLACPVLESLVARREDVKERLAHAQAFEQIHGRRKTKARLNIRGLGGSQERGLSRSLQNNKNSLVETIDSIELLELKLRSLTKDIAIAYQNIERSNDPYSLDQHREMVMAEIEEMRFAERAQNIATRERVNSCHDLENAEEICHVQENLVKDEILPVNDRFSKGLEAFFFGDLSPQQRRQQQEKQLLLLQEGKDQKKDDFRVTIHTSQNKVHYMSWRDEMESNEFGKDNEFHDEKKSDGYAQGRRLVHNAFPSKSTISTVTGIFDNHKWNRNSFFESTGSEYLANPDQTTGRIITIPRVERAASASSSDDERSDESGYAKIRQILRQKGHSYSSDESSSDELKSSGHSWTGNATKAFRKVGQGVQMLGEEVGKTVVGVGTDVGKATKKATKKSMKVAGDLGISDIRKVGELGVKNVQNVAVNVNKFGLQAAELGVENIKTIRASAAAIAPVVISHEEGKALEAGFVVFKDLYSTQAALQMLQDKEAGVMRVEEAPGPAEIFWRNVGLPATAQRTGRLLSLTATVLLCLFWTVPISFISALTEVNSLKENVPVLEDWVEKYPSLEGVLALIAPLLLLILQDVILPEFLAWFAAWEGHISSSTLESAVFVKYAAFVLVQTFFISAISGSISAELSNMLNEPDQFIDFLANALPAQSNYFLQILVVAMAVTMGLEMLRVSPLTLAFVRKFVGPNLTEEERRKPWKFITPLEDPKGFEHANVSGSVVLYFMVFFVYCCLAPVSCFFLLIMFVLMESGYRYNFFHNYPPFPDSGGKLWKGFFHIILACMIVAQLTLVGFLVLKKSLYAIPFMVPLLVISVLFIFYLNQYKVHAADHLPTIDCVAVDMKNRFTDYTFAKDQYVQPCIKEARSDEIFEII